MHMKKMVAALALAGVGVAFADVAVTDVKVQPRTPWNGLVDVEYTLACDDPDADVYVNPVGYDGDRRITLFPQAFTGDSAEGPVKAGKHTLVWDAVKDFGHAFSCAHFQLKFYAGKRLAPYVVIDVSSGSSSTNYPVRFEMKGPDLTKDTCRTDEIWMRLVPPGEFWMGSPESEVGRNNDEDLHHVTLTKPFYIGVFEMTKGQFINVMGSDYSGFFSGANKSQRPVEQIYRYYYSNVGATLLAKTIGCSYDPAATTLTSGFLGKLCNRAHVGGFNLPTEAQWEYACRAGEMTALNNGANLDDLNDSSNLNLISRYMANGYNNQEYSSSDVLLGTATVGSYQPNRLGLYDMIGNVAEMCRDEYTARLGWAALVNPTAVSLTHSGSSSYYYVFKGGCWRSLARYCRSASRSYNWGDTGNVWHGFHYYLNSSPSCYLTNDSSGFRLYSDASF